MEGTFDRVLADEEVLARYLGSIREGNLTGINITMPLKAAAARMVDKMSLMAEAARSVNTVRLAEGELVGESTDAIAMQRLLSEHWIDVGPVYILGSGGSAAAAAIASGERVVYVASRNKESAARLADRLPDGSVVPWGVPVAGAVLINATPLGMNGEDLPPGIVEAAAGIIDLAYGAKVTPAMSRAYQSGVSTVDGIEFLVAQAADSFRVWTGFDPPVEVMLEAARQAVSDRNT